MVWDLAHPPHKNLSNSIFFFHSIDFFYFCTSNSYIFVSFMDFPIKTISTKAPKKENEISASIKYQENYATQKTKIKLKYLPKEK